MQLAMRGNLSALRLPWSPLLALRMQMFSDQSPSLMDGGLTLARSGLNGAFLVGRCERSAGRPRPPPHSPSEKTARLEYRIDAHAFATWLHTQKQEPSAHIAVWFEVRGVTWPPVLAVDADTVADWPGLVALVKSRKKGTRWTEGEVAILRAEFARRGGWSREADGQPWVKNSSIQSDMATELGFAARSALDRHLGDGPDRGAAVMSSAVGALTGTR